MLLSDGISKSNPRHVLRTIRNDNGIVILLHHEGSRTVSIGTIITVFIEPIKF